MGTAVYISGENCLLGRATSKSELRNASNTQRLVRGILGRRKKKHANLEPRSLRQCVQILYQDGLGHLGQCLGRDCSKRRPGSAGQHRLLRGLTPSNWAQTGVLTKDTDPQVTLIKAAPDIPLPTIFLPSPALPLPSSPPPPPPSLSTSGMPLHPRGPPCYCSGLAIVLPADRL
jgi:hypothetical protein